MFDYLSLLFFMGLLAGMGACYNYLYQAFEPRFSKWVYVLVWIGHSLMIFICCLNESLLWYKSIVVFTGIVGVAVLMYRGSLGRRILFAGKLVLFLIFLDLLNYFFLLIIGVGGTAGAPHTLRYYLVGVSQTLFTLILYRPFKRIFLKWNEAKKKNEFQDVIFIMVFLVECLAACWVNEYSLVIQPNGGNNLVIYFMAVLLVDVALLYIFKQMEIGYQKEKALELLKQERELQHQDYTTLEAQYQQSRQFIHDMENHLVVMGRIAEQRDQQRFQTYTQSVMASMGTIKGVGNE